MMRNYQPFAILAITAGGSSAEGSHTCALTDRGGVKCWGANAYGQLGDGTRTSRLTPVDVTGLTSRVTAISVGGGSTCALTELGGVKCWGSDSVIQSLTPKDIASLTSGVKAISNSPNHACALTNAGSVKCWGANDYGQLGDGTKTRRTAPVDVIGLSEGVQAISSGYWHTCALTIGGAVKCWGSRPGNGMEEDTTTPVDVSGLSNGVIAISAGGAHSCAILSGGVKCWGSGGYGQLGNGTNTTSLVPVDVIKSCRPYDFAFSEVLAYVRGNQQWPGTVLGKQLSRPDWRRHNRKPYYSDQREWIRQRNNDGNGRALAHLRFAYRKPRQVLGSERGWTTRGWHHH